MCPCLLFYLVMFLCSSLAVGLVLHPCPKGCCCPHPGDLVLCESLGLQTVPRSIPLSTSALSVARNHLCNVDNRFQLYLGLQELSLGHNQLARFPRGLPPSLETLQLQENQITYITAGSLRQLGNLTHLNLDDNRIRVIQPGALLGLTRLRMLSLKGNRLSHLPVNLPSSLTHLDVSSNCISTLDLPSLGALVNLQVLKMNSNCLRSIPERAFDGLPRLQSVELANNLWVCECDIIYLYRWLLTDRLRMATDLVCTAPLHLAQKLLLTLSVMAVCPKLFKPIERTSTANSTTSEKVVKSHIEQMTTASTLVRSDTTCNMSSFRCKSSSKQSNSTVSSDEIHSRASLLHGNLPRSFLKSDQRTLEKLSYEDCLSLNFMSYKTQSTQQPYNPVIDKQPDCVETSTGQIPGASATIGSPGSMSPTKNGLDITPRTVLQSSNPALIGILAVLCVLTGLLMVTVLLVLKNVLLRNLRVAPLQPA